MQDQPHDVGGAREAAAVDSQQLHGQVSGEDGGPVDEQDMAAAQGLEASEQVSENYEDLLERGAATRGEGRVS